MNLSLIYSETIVNENRLFEPILEKNHDIQTDTITKSYLLTALPHGNFEYLSGKNNQYTTKA